MFGFLWKGVIKFTMRTTYRMPISKIDALLAFLERSLYSPYDAGYKNSGYRTIFRKKAENLLTVLLWISRVKKGNTSNRRYDAVYKNSGYRTIFRKKAENLLTVLLWISRVKKGNTSNRRIMIYNRIGSGTSNISTELSNVSIHPCN